MSFTQIVDCIIHMEYQVVTEVRDLFFRYYWVAHGFPFLSVVPVDSLLVAFLIFFITFHLYPLHYTVSLGRLAKGKI